MSADVVAASSDTVRVLVRIRPPNARERDSGYVEAARRGGDNAALDALCAKAGRYLDLMRGGG